MDRPMLILQSPEHLKSIQEESRSPMLSTTSAQWIHVQRLYQTLIIPGVRKMWGFRKTISETYDPRNNAFDILRFIMASLVIVHHSYDLLQFSNVNWFIRFTRWQLTLGEFAVSSFFIISGFLVMQSLESSKTLNTYLVKRFLRLFPGLFAALFLTAVCLGPLITSQSLWQYFTGNQGTSPWEFMFLNFTLNLFGYEYSLRDLFIHNPLPIAVNGSLWTLKHEFASYLILGGLSVLGFRKRPKLLILFAGLVGGAYLANELAGFNLMSGITTGWWIFHSAEFPYFLSLFWLFLLGALLYVYRQQIFVSPKLLILLTVVLLVSIKFGYLRAVWYIASPYLIISLATLLPFSWFSKYGDFSYGIYIYAFPVQQTLVLLLFPDISVYRLMSFSFFITLVLAIFSWHFIEKPSLKLKKRFM